MATRMHEMGTRYNDLRDQGVPSEEAAKRVNEEFKSDISHVTIRGYGSLCKKKSEGGERRSLDKGHKKDRTSPKRKKAEKQPAKGTAELVPATEIDERIKAVARQVFQKMFYGMREEMNTMADMQDVPPEPRVIKGEGKGRREDRQYTKASVTVDKVLWNLFVKERDRLRVSTGRLMDIVLWRHFGKPKLSYEK